MTKLSILSLALAGCWSASHPSTNAGGVDVTVASVALASDCDDDDAAADAAPAGPSRSQHSSHASASCAGPGMCGGVTSSCEQTTIQLKLHSTGDTASTIAIKRIELLDPSGKSLGTMASRKPTRWTDGNGYEAWNEKIDARQSVTASYALSLPDDVDDLDVSKKYTVRVTLTIGGEDRTVEKQAAVSAPAIPEPHVVT